MSDRQKANRAHDAKRRQEQPHRGLYGTARWRAVRHDQLTRHPLCAYHLQREQYVAATVCHHVNPADKEKAETFFRGPFESLCKGCHDSAGQKEDKGNGPIGCDVDGNPLDPNSHWNK